MKNVTYLTTGRKMKTGGKICWLFLLFVSLMAMLTSGTILAQKESVDLTLILVADHYYNKVKPGEDNSFFLEIKNTGNKAITDIRLLSNKPEGWVIDFKPSAIDYLGAGSLQTVDVNIKPATNADRGEHSITFIAEASETRKVTNFWVRVEKSTSVWLWIGIILALVLAAGFIIVFKRLSRQ